MNRSLTALLAAAAASLVLASPAAAQLTVATDEKGDDRLHSDIRKLTVDHTEKRVTLKLRLYADRKAEPSEAPDRTYYFLDSHGDAAPDFVVTAVVKNELADEPATYVSTAKGWPARKARPWEAVGEEVDCGLHVTKVRDSGRLVVTTLGRGCLKTDGAMPARLRVHAAAHTDELGPNDFLGAWKTYTKWVTAG